MPNLSNSVDQSMAADPLSSGTIIKAFAPAINDIYNLTKSTLSKRIQGWKIGSDLERFERYYSRLSMIKTIWARDEAVSIDTFYFPSRLTGHKTKEIITTIDDLGADCVIIEGIVGQGKSVLMRYLAMETFKNPTTKAIPLFVEFRNISEKTNLKQLLSTTLSSLGASSEMFVLDHLLEENRLILFLDGYDEIEPKLLKDTTQEITNLQTTYPKLKIIVSSRPSSDIQNVPGFTVKKLAPLRTRDHQPFLRKLGLKTPRVIEIADAITESPAEIQEAISTPLMLSIVVLVYKSANQIPPYLAEFFKVLFHVVFTQHDNRKDSFRREHHTGLSESELQTLFEAFCYTVTKKGYGRTLSSEQFNECFEIAQSLTRLPKTTEKKFKDDIVRVACLLLEEGIGDLTFLHKSILDFFAASFISKLKREDSAKNFYAAAAQNYTVWRGALQFLGKIDQYKFNKFYYLEFVYEDWLKYKDSIKSGKDSDFITYTSELFSETRIEKTNTGMSTRFRPRVAGEFGVACIKAMTHGCHGPIMFDPSVDSLTEQFTNTKGATFETLKNKGLGFNLRSAQLVVGCESMIEEMNSMANIYEENFKAARNHIVEVEEQEKLLEINLD